MTLSYFAWLHVASPLVAAFLASLVECIEALTIVLAVGAARGWPHALGGASAGPSLLVLAILLFGTALSRIPVRVLQVGVGALLLLFGTSWLRKAVLRAAGVVPLRDEAAAYVRAVRSLERGPAALVAGWDPVAAATVLKAVVLEGLEVVFIVLAVGHAGGALMPASLGAAIAAVLVVGLGFVLHRPLTRAPENTLKFAVGVLLPAFGVFWLGEGLGLEWPGGDAAAAALVAGTLAMAGMAVLTVRRQVSVRSSSPRPATDGAD